MWCVRKVIECLPCCRSSTAKAKKTDMPSKDNAPDLEAGNDDWEFDSWDDRPKPQVQAQPPPVLQKLDDFDGMAPVASNEEEKNEPDFFGELGLSPKYEPPKKAVAKKPVSNALQLGLDDDDIDLDGWETGNTKKPKKKLGGVRVS